jgi:HD-GYP domain-containing protein (c-di-GMP phosphodiesterase class II)
MTEDFAASMGVVEEKPGAASEAVPAGLGLGVAVAEMEGVAAYSVCQLERVRDLLARLAALRKLARFYPGSHPAVDEAAGELFSSISAYHREGVEVQLAFHEGEIIFGEQRLPAESIMFDQLVREVTDAGVGALVFRLGLTAAELEAAVPLLAADSIDVARAGGLQMLASACNAPHIFVGEVHVVDDTMDGDAVEVDPLVAYNDAVALVHEVERLLAGNRTVSASRVKAVVRGLVDNVVKNEAALLQLSALKKADEYTYYHSANVSILSIALGSRITSDRRFLTALGTSSLLHDIGKLSVDPVILNKPGALTPEEWALLRAHPIRGAEIAALTPGVDRAAVVAILEHHMRYDLEGYPKRLVRRPQHLSSRIVAIADTYDAMTSRRSYSAPRVQDEAIGVIAKIAGSALDPDLSRLFIRLMGIYPPRSVVRLSSGETAIVLGAGALDPALPSVRVIADAAGVIIKPRDVDLASEERLSVAGCLDASTLNIAVEDFL